MTVGTPVADIAKLLAQIETERKLVSFDSYDLTVKQLLEMYSEGQVVVPPEYQRQFVWGDDRQSELVESVLLGIPVPSLFMAANRDGSWEVVDGVQRIGSLSRFVASPELLARTNAEKGLEISGLRKLVELNGYAFGDLPKSLQFMFLTRPVRITVLNDKSDLEVRYDLFERLNTGGVSLTNQEIRNCVFRGPFNDSIRQLAEDPNFRHVVRLKPSEASNGTREELVLRFFAFLESYKDFDHSVEGFLNDFMRKHVGLPISEAKQRLFREVFAVVRGHFPDGLTRKGRGVTPVNLYEAVAVGSAMALNSPHGQIIHWGRLPQITASDELKKLTTGATNSKRMVAGRIEYVRDGLL